jgi:hypothetical protein
VSRLGFCPLTGYNPGLLPAFSLDIILRGDIFIKWGCQDGPLCRRCGAENETSAHILWECEASASLRPAYLGFFFLEPEDIKSISLGAIWNNFSKVTGLP